MATEVATIQRRDYAFLQFVNGTRAGITDRLLRDSGVVGDECMELARAIYAEWTAGKNFAVHRPGIDLVRSFQRFLASRAHSFACLCTPDGIATSLALSDRREAPGRW